MCNRKFAMKGDCSCCNEPLDICRGCDDEIYYQMKQAEKADDNICYECCIEDKSKDCLHGLCEQCCGMYHDCFDMRNEDPCLDKPPTIH